jgi:hypothetical protein
MDTPKVATPTPPQNTSAMAPAKAGHLDAPVGIPSGPSMQEMMVMLQQQGNAIAELTQALQQAKSRGFVPEDVVEVEVEKTYFHQTPGSNIVVTDRGPNGEHIPRMVHFDHHGELTTKDRTVQAFLDPICDKPGVPIYSSRAPSIDPIAAAAAREVQKSAEQTIIKLGPEAGALKG